MPVGPVSTTRPTWLQRGCTRRARRRPAALQRPCHGGVDDLQGTLLEACSCPAVCPCWVGQDPDGGSCDAFDAYRFQHGTIRGVDVSGLSFINVVHIPGNVLAPGSRRVVSFVDDRASDEQFQAILDAYHGRLGGPLADLAGLAGVFQFSSLKDRCLTECRHPVAYLLRHYRRGPRAAFHLGWGHGLDCLGRCWALMLVMFSVGVADLGWMAALAGLMAYEKLGRHGKAPPPPPAWPPWLWPRWSPCTRRGCRRSWPAWPAPSAAEARGRRPHLSPCQQLDL
jgi:hypothetical protein